MSALTVRETDLPGVWIVTAERVGDERGWFARVFDEDVFARHGLCVRWPQHGEAHNPRAGTVRGLHFQREPLAQAKLVRCERGALFDVAVDLRPDAPSYGRWFGIDLRADAPQALYIPAGFAHGYQTLVDETDVHYLTSARYDPALGAGIAFDSPALGIRWPLGGPIVSPRDRALPVFER
jgi:dTDP-4-dehydrorhamnose 3,5-epimerase